MKKKQETVKYRLEDLIVAADESAVKLGSIQNGSCANTCTKSLKQNHKS
ncbi:MAG: hypothetical protein HOL16_02650 [Alphaproteobacteria bacterium]|nr:hypothetical protein [Alphaproteobacteria bacterium]